MRAFIYTRLKRKMHQQKSSKNTANNPAGRKQVRRGDAPQMPERVAPPSEPICFQNPDFKLTIEQIFSVFLQHKILQRIFLSGGCLSRSYLDPFMSEGHKQSFGDLDFKLPLCTQEEVWALLSYLHLYQLQSGVVTLEKARQYSSPLVDAFHQLFNAGAVFKKFYTKQKQTVHDYQTILHRRTVVNIDWRGVSVEFIAFEESLEEHALRLDLSIGAGFYNPLMKKIYFPCDELMEVYADGLAAPRDRSAKDFKNKELNLLFPAAYIALFDEDPIRILRIIQALSRSDFTLSKELEANIHQYVELHRHHVFKQVNPDRLYYNLKLIFMSGHAVQNLEKIVQFNLVEELFVYLQTLPTKQKALTYYLLKRVAIESDNDCRLPASLLFYAVHWSAIKYQPYNPYLIFNSSEETIRLSASDNCLSEGSHQANIAQLTGWERNYHIDFLALTGMRIIQEKNRMQALADKNRTPWVKPAANFLNTRQHILASISEEESLQLLIDPVYVAHYQGAMLALSIGKLKEAKETFKVAIKLNSSLPDAYCGLGQVLQRQAENYSASIQAAMDRLIAFKKKSQAFKAAIRKTTQELETYEQQQQAKYLEAVAYYEQALARNASHKPAIDLLQSIGDRVKSFYDRHPEPTPVKLDRVDNIIPFVASIQTSAVKSVSLKIKKNTTKTASIIENATVLIESTVTQDVNQTNEKQKILIQEAIKEENLGHYQKALDLYVKSTAGSRTIMIRHQCIKLYVKLNQYDNAFKYVDRLVDMTEDFYHRRYHSEQLSQEKPFDNYQYHYYYSIYQRGKIHLVLKQYNEAIRDFEVILKEHDRCQDDPHNVLVEIAMRVFIQMGNAMHQLAAQEKEEIMVNDTRYKIHTMPGDTLANQQKQKKTFEMNLSKLIEKENHAKQEYINAIRLVKKLSPAFDYKLIPIHLGLGSIEQSLGRLEGPESASQQYAWVLQLIEANIKSNFYTQDDSIYQAFFQCAEYISGSFINKMIGILLMKASFVARDSDMHFLNLSMAIYKKSIRYAHDKFRQAHIQLIKIEIILSQYDLAIFQIERLLSGDYTRTSCCRRELLLLQGECYERKLMHDVAIEYYQKSQIFRYEDDNKYHHELIQLAQNAVKRVKKIKKEMVQGVGFHELSMTPSVQNVIHALSDMKIGTAESTITPSVSEADQQEQWAQNILESLCLGMYEAVVQLCNEAIIKNDKNLKAYQQRAQAHIFLEEHESALRDCDYLMRVPETFFDNPDNVIYLKPFDTYETHRYYVHCLLGTAHLVKKDTEQAFRCFTWVIEQYDSSIIKNPTLNSIVSRSCLGMGNAIEIEIQRLRQTTMARYGHFKTFAEEILKKETEAKIFYRRAMELFANLSFPDAEAYIGLIKIEASQGHTDVVEKHYLNYLQILNDHLKQNPNTRPETMYQMFYSFAESISGEKITKMMSILVRGAGGQSLYFDETDLILFNRAKDTYLKAIEFLPEIKPLHAHERLALIAFVLGCFDEAIQRIEDLLKGNMKSIQCSKREFLYMCGVMHEGKESHTDAKKYFYQSASTTVYDDDNEYASYVTKAANEALKKIITDALARAQVIQPTTLTRYTDEHWFTQGEAKRKANEFQDAADAYCQALEINPEHLMARRRRIDMNANLKKYRLVIPDCDFLMRIDRDQYNSTYALTQTSRMDNYDYHYSHALYERGYAYFYLSDYDNARIDFVEIIENYSESTDPFLKAIVVQIYTNIEEVLKQRPPAVQKSSGIGKFSLFVEQAKPAVQDSSARVTIELRPPSRL